MKKTFVAAGALAVLIAGCHRQNETAVAEVNGRIITEGEAASELRNLLWRRDVTWSALGAGEQKANREKALENLINGRLITEFAASHASGSASLKSESEEEFQHFLKQFQPPDEWKERMNLQGLDEGDLRSRIIGEVSHVAAIESWLEQHPGKVTESDARKWFEAHAKDIYIPDGVRAGHIFLTRHDKDKPDREPEIRELHRQLTAGEAAFEELAAKHSDDEAAKLRGGDLGWFTRHRVPPEFAEKVFAMSVGETSAPFESHLGWHIVRVKDKRPRRTATFEEIKNEITARLDHEWRDACVRRLIDGLRAKANIVKFADRIATISPE